MCTQADHNVEPVAANTQPTTAVVAAKPQKRVYSWEYGSPNKLNLIKSNDASSELDLSAGLNANQVAYYFDANNVPTHKRIVNLATEKVEPDDIIFQQDFMKTQKTTVSPYSVVVYDNGDLTKPIRSTDFDNEKDAKRILGKLIKPTEVTYMYAGGVPVKKRFRGEDPVQIVANDPIWNANAAKPVPVATTTSKLEARFYNKIDLKVPTRTSIVDKLENYDYLGYGVNGINSSQVVYIFENDKPIKKRGYCEKLEGVTSTDPIWGTLQIKPEPKAQIEIRVYSQNDLNTAVLSKIVESFDELEWRKTPLASDKIAYAFVDGKPVKSRKGNMKTEDVLLLDPIWETLKPKAGQMVAKKQFKVVSYKSAGSINTVTKEEEFDNMSNALYALKQFDMGYGREEMRYLFKDGIAIKKRLIDQDPDDVTAIDVFFPNGVLVVQVKEPVASVAVTPTVDTEKPISLQEFLKELMKAHEDKQHKYFDESIFKALLQKFWPEKVEYYNDKYSTLTGTYRMFNILNNWNPPAQKKVKKHKLHMHETRYNFIVKAAQLANISNPSDKFVESIESFGTSVNMFIGNWKNDIRVALAKHFNNPEWLKNGVHTVNQESYKLEQIDLVLA